MSNYVGQVLITLVFLNAIVGYSTYQRGGWTLLFVRNIMAALVSIVITYLVRLFRRIG